MEESWSGSSFRSPGGDRHHRPVHRRLFWNDWFNSLIYLKSSQFPVMLFLRNIVNGTTMLGGDAGSAGGADKGALSLSIKSAVILVSTLPIIMIYPFVQRFFVKGVLVGSVKG
jgi:putative aldouronate transport system permease protein